MGKADKKAKRLLWKILFLVLCAAVSVVGIGYVLNNLLLNMETYLAGGPLFRVRVLKDPGTYLYGAVFTAFIVVLYFGLGKSKKSAKHIIQGSRQQEGGPLENSRFMTEAERDKNFPAFTYAKAASAPGDGVPMRAELVGKHLKINVSPGSHSLIIGSTGSGKTTTFINPMIQIISETAAGSSMIMTDPKGELFSLHSKKLQDQGYDVKVLDLRDTYSSYRWNPLEGIYDRYQDYVEAGKGILVHTEPVQIREGRAYVAGDGGEYELELAEAREEYEGREQWLEYRGRAYAGRQICIDDISIIRQKIYDEMYEDLNDLVSVICPIESKDDPVWEKGARSIMMAVLVAMLEDSENPELGMTREKYNFYNLNKAISNSEDEFKALKDYFKGRSRTSTAVTLSRQVMSAAEATLSSYMSIAFDKLSMFNDRGLCALTSATDIDAFGIADRPTALFLKIPDEKDTRHTLASVFILCMYKALIKKASSRKDLSLPRNVYFILDEFGNMPKIEKFDKMITVGRSRKIWFNMVVQSYAQLNNVYGETVAGIVKSNCGVKMFIGSNDIETCKEFSELCGNITISTSSVSSGTGDKTGELSVSTQLQTRPLIYPSELQKLNNKDSTGNAIIVTFGNYPLRTKFTPSYKCPLYKMGEMDLSEARRNTFYADRVLYSLEERNDKILEG